MRRMWILCRRAGRLGLSRDGERAPAWLWSLREMRRYILTGAPGAGKTAILRQLELDGFSVVEEAATDVIAAAQAQRNDGAMDGAGIH